MKERKAEKFLMLWKEIDGVQLKQCSGIRHTIMGFVCFLSEDPFGGFVVTESQTGMQVSIGNTDKQAISAARRKLKEGKGYVALAIQKITDKGVEVPVNKLS